MVGDEAVSTLWPSGIPPAETFSAPCQGNQEKVSLFPSPTLYPPRQQRQIKSFSQEHSNRLGPTCAVPKLTYWLSPIHQMLY